VNRKWWAALSHASIDIEKSICNRLSAKFHITIIIFCARCISEGRDEVYEETQLEAEIAQLKKRISTLKNTEDFDEASEQHMRVIHDDVTLHRH